MNQAPEQPRYPDPGDYYTVWSGGTFITHMHGFDLWSLQDSEGAAVVLVWGRRGMVGTTDCDAGSLFPDTLPRIEKSMRDWNGYAIPAALRPRIPEVAAFVHSFLQITQ